jgi:2-oxoglutarate ferredoxin oxidoreductase subunit gamma
MGTSWSFTDGHDSAHLEQEVLIAGIGGQGIQLVGKVLALAATLAGKHAMLAADYGGEMRGGPSQSTVVVGEAPLRALPIVPTVGAAIVMHDRFTGTVPERLRPGGLLLVNSSIVTADPEMVAAYACVDLPVIEIARDLGAPAAAGLVMLGAFAGLTAVAQVERLVDAMRVLLPPYRQQHAAANAQALEAGWATGTDRRVTVASA